MSPEQAKGMNVDRHTEIFSFGAVLYEMLTGRQAFEDETVSEIMARGDHAGAGLEPFAGKYACRNSPFA
jgi:serine/threonine protein kinase